MELIGTGHGHGNRRVRGAVRILEKRHEYSTIVRGEIAVLRYADSEFVIWLDCVAGIVCRSGGTLAHLSLLAMEAGVPYLVLQRETGPLATGDIIMLDPVVGTLTR